MKYRTSQDDLTHRIKTCDACALLLGGLIAGLLIWFAPETRAMDDINEIRDRYNAFMQFYEQNGGEVRQEVKDIGVLLSQLVRSGELADGLEKDVGDLATSEPIRGSTDSTRKS